MVKIFISLTRGDFNGAEALNRGPNGIFNFKNTEILKIKKRSRELRYHINRNSSKDKIN